MTDAPGSASADPASLVGGAFLALDLTSGRSHATGSILAHLGVRVARPCASAAAETSTPRAWFESSGVELWEVAERVEVDPLIDTADVLLLDSGTPSAWGLTPEAASARNPGAIVSVVTRFGLEGPWARNPATELTTQASAGQMWLVGYADRSPVPMGGSQSGYQAAAQAAVGILAALFDRQRRGGSGELVDTSAQEAMCNTIAMSKAWWYLGRKNLKRSHMNTIGGQAPVRVVWRASDGDISWRITIGLGTAKRQMPPMIDWMRSEGFGEELAGIQWETISTIEVKPADLRTWEAEFGRFFATHTRAELFEGARKRDIMLLPVLALHEVLADAHVVARRSFAIVEHDGGSFSVPNFPVRFGGRHQDRLPPRPVVRGQMLASPRDHAGPEPARAPAAGAPPAGDRRPLAGVRILDFGWAVAGPVTTRLLGLLGATVVKVESNSRFDSTRASTPFAGRPSRDRSGYFASHNSNKLSLLLDLNHPQSRAVLERLVRWADVVGENYSAGRMEGWDLGFERLCEWNPEVVMLRSSTWGQDGPYKEVPATGVVLGGFAGFGALNGWPDRPALLSVEPYTDFISPSFNAAAVIAALLARLASGEGTLLDVSQLDCALNFLGPELADASRGVVPRKGILRCEPYPEGIFQCAGEDEWCALSVEGPEQWRALCAQMTGLAGSGDLDAEAIAGMAPFLFAMLAAYFRLRPAAEAARALQRAGIAAAKVATPEDIHNDPQLSFRHHFVELAHPAMERFAFEMPSFRYRDRAIVPERSPLIGEHTGLVLGDFLGYSADEIADLYASGVLA